MSPVHRPRSSRRTSVRALLLVGLLTAGGGAAATGAEPPRPWALAVGDRNRDFAAAIAVDAAGRTYVAGQFQGSGRLLASHAASRLQAAGDSDLFVLALDPAGGFLWARRFGGPGQDEARAVATDPAGNVYVTGFFTRAAEFETPDGNLALRTAGAAGSSDVLVLKLDPEGNLTWVRGFGGERGDVGFDLAVSPEGAVYVTGYFQGEADLDPGEGRLAATSAGGTDAFVVKLDAAGALVWARAGGGGGADEGRALAVSGDGLAVAGNFTGAAAFPAGGDSPREIGGRDLFLWRLDAEGRTAGVGSLGGPGGDSVEDLAADGDGGIVASGSFTTELGFGGEDSPRTADGPIDAFVARWDAAGRPSWLRTLGGGGTDFAFGVAADPGSGTLLAAGFSQLPMAEASRSGEFRSWVQAFDAAGQPRWRRELTSDTAIQALGMALAPGGWPHVTGIFKGTARVELGGDDAELPPRGKFDVFVARLRP